MLSSLDSLEYNVYGYPESLSHYPKPEPMMINSIEFMDLTAPQHDSQRRKRSSAAQDKEAVSNMRIVSNPNHPSPRHWRLTPPSAPTSPKPRLATRIPRAQRKACATLGATTRRARNQASQAHQIVHRSRQHARSAEARSKTTPQRTRAAQVIERTVPLGDHGAHAVRPIWLRHLVRGASAEHLSQFPDGSSRRTRSCSFPLPLLIYGFCGA